jgi:hypothetical protein
MAILVVRRMQNVAMLEQSDRVSMNIETQSLQMTYFSVTYWICQCGLKFLVSAFRDVRILIPLLTLDDLNMLIFRQADIDLLPSTNRFVPKINRYS